MKTNHHLIVLILLAALMLSGCGSGPSVGELRSESQEIALDDASAVRVEIDMAAGKMDVAGGAEQLLEADFTYNIDKLKPEVAYTNETLVIRQSEIQGVPDWRGITDFRNEWGLRLYDEVPIDLSVNVGGGSADLQLADLSLTGFDVNLGAGEYMIDLSGDWAQDLDATIDAGAANIRLLLPKDVGTRIRIGEGPHTVEIKGLTYDGNVYTNDTYGLSEVTLQVELELGIGEVTLEVVDT